MTSAAQIVIEFPEMAAASSALLSAKLADAEQLTAADYGGDNPALRALRVKYLALELVVQSPGGEFARLDPNKEPDGARSLYERQRLQIDRSVTAPMVI
jgi:hypothetical protein